MGNRNGENFEIRKVIIGNRECYFVRCKRSGEIVSGREPIESLHTANALCAELNSELQQLERRGVA